LHNQNIVVYLYNKIKQIEIMKTPKLTSAQKLAFYKENGYWFGTTPKATLKPAENVVIDRASIFAEEEVKMMSSSERVAIEEANIAMRNNARKNNL